ncbi:DUF4442 domain-containing protein, partial [Pseudomonas aeruginosa]
MECRLPSLWKDASMPKRNRLSRAVGAINLLPRRLRSRSL